MSFLSVLLFSVFAMQKPTALVTGITGQDGPYLAKHLLEKGYRVVGTYRRSAQPRFYNLEELGIKDQIQIEKLEMSDLSAVTRLIQKVNPDEIYNLAAQSFVMDSFESPFLTIETTGIAPVVFLEAVRIVNPKIKMYQASSSEMFGEVLEIPQKETTPLNPMSPYGAAKQLAHSMMNIYRKGYNLFVCSGILFNHESPIRGPEFVTRKITQAIALIVRGKQDCLELGNLDAKRDWGFAGDYVEAMHLILQQETPEDFVIATNRTETVRFFVKKAFEYAGISLKWEGEGIDEVGIDQETGKILVKVDPKFYRPAEVDILIGDYSKAKEKLSWEPKVQLEDLIKMMVEADLKKESK